MISGSIKYSSSTSSNRSFYNDHGSEIIDNNTLVVHGSESYPNRTLEDVRQQVAQEVAMRVITNAETIDGEMLPCYRVPRILIAERRQSRRLLDVLKK